jgi:putative transposase
MPEEQRNEVAFLSLKAEREIKGDVRVGRRPYIQYENVRYKRLKLFHFTTSDDPVKVYQRFLEEGAKTKKRSASKAYEMERNQNRNKDNDIDVDVVPTPTLPNQTNEDHELAEKNRENPKNFVAKQSTRTLRKTIIY